MGLQKADQSAVRSAAGQSVSQREVAGLAAATQRAEPDAIRAALAEQADGGSVEAALAHGAMEAAAEAGTARSTANDYIRTLGE